MLSLFDILEHYLSVNVRITKQATREHYFRSLRQFAAVLGHEPTTEDLTDDNLARWMIATVDQGNAEATANQRVKQVRALWEWAARRRMVEAFPTIKRMQEPEPMPVAWRSHELTALFNACSVQRGWIGPHRAATWWLCLHWWAYDTGERTAATFALRREWIDLANGTVSVPAKVRKGGRKGMVYRLRPRTCELFAEMLSVPSDTGLVFDRPWNDWQTFYGRYRKLVKGAGLPWVVRKTGLKKMRITVFTTITAMGGDATAFARHSSRTVTESYIDRTILAACQNGAWPSDAAAPDKPIPPWWRRMFNRPA